MTPTTKGAEPNEEPEPEEVGAEIEAVEEAQVPALIAEADAWAAVPDGDMAPEKDFAALSLIPLNKKIDGGFTDPDTGETKMRELHFIWLAKSKSRGAFIEEVDGKVARKPYDAKNPEGPGCRSGDGIKADPNSPLLQNSGDCTTCPLSVWNGDEPPICKAAIEAMVFLPDPHGFGRLARVRFNGIALAPARAYWRSFAERMPRRPPMAYVTRCELVETETPNGTFLVPHFARASDVAFDQAAPLIAERDRRIAEWQESIARDVAEMRPDDENGGAGPFDESAPSQPVVLDDGSEF